MSLKSLCPAYGRRDFLFRVLPAGTVFCLGAGGLTTMSAFQEPAKTAGNKHKFLEDSGMSFQEVYEFTFKDYYIPVLRILAPYIKDSDFIDTLKHATDDLIAKETQTEAKKGPEKDFATFKAEFHKSDRFWDHVLTMSTVEETDKAIEARITECLWAKTFCEAKAADIGYATICYPDYASARAYNPKLKLIRTKTLMQGDDHCNHRWVWEG